jgi:hypothetical protein
MSPRALHQLNFNLDDLRRTKAAFTEFAHRPERQAYNTLKVPPKRSLTS